MPSSCGRSPGSSHGDQVLPSDSLKVLGRSSVADRAVGDLAVAVGDELEEPDPGLAAPRHRDDRLALDLRRRQAVRGPLVLDLGGVLAEHERRLGTGDVGESPGLGTAYGPELVAAAVGERSRRIVDKVHVVEPARLLTGLWRRRGREPLHFLAGEVEDGQAAVLQRSEYDAPLGVPGVASRWRGRRRSRCRRRRRPSSARSRRRRVTSVSPLAYAGWHTQRDWSWQQSGHRRSASSSPHPRGRQGHLPPH